MALAVSSCRVLAASNPRDSSRWDELVDRAPISDVYYRPGYARAYEAAGHGKAIGLVLAAHDVQVLVPLLLRPLSNLPFASFERGFDATTPYGYGGLLPLSATERLAEDDASALLDELRQWCQEAGVVSCLIRLHPLLNQDRWFGQDYWQQQASSLQYRAPTVALDLGRWDSERQRVAGLRKNRRVALNQARRHLRVAWSGSDLPLPEALALFREIYEQRMTSLAASSYYFFPLDYYTSLVEGLGGKLAVALAWMDCRLVGTSLFLADRQFAHYHLSASNEEGRQLEAGTLLINAGAQWARERGCQMLHLGGGLNDGDGLFDYKRSFGGGVHRYHTLQVVADESRYRDLVERRLRGEPLCELQQGFFPQYRA